MEVAIAVTLTIAFLVLALAITLAVEDHRAQRRHEELILLALRTRAEAEKALELEATLPPVDSTPEWIKAIRKSPRTRPEPPLVLSDSHEAELEERGVGKDQ